MKRVTPLNYYPILISPGLIKPVQDGIKTQTRRIVKFPKDWDGERVFDNSPYGLKYGRPDDTVWRLPSPYGLPGDFLWVRETFAVYPYSGKFSYMADDPLMWLKWKPSIHMPFEACRIILEVVSVGVERLNDISGQDACDEGIINKSITHPADEFATLWESINGKGSWKLNPWVWVIKFEKV